MLASLLFHTRKTVSAHIQTCVGIDQKMNVIFALDTNYVELGFTFPHQGWGLMKKKKKKRKKKKKKKVGGGLNCLRGAWKTFLMVFICIIPHPHKCLWLVLYLVWIPFGWWSKSVVPTFTLGTTPILLHKQFGPIAQNRQLCPNGQCYS